MFLTGTILHHVQVHVASSALSFGHNKIDKSLSFNHCLLCTVSVTKTSHVGCFKQGCLAVGSTSTSTTFDRSNRSVQFEWKTDWSRCPSSIAFSILWQWSQWCNQKWTQSCLGWADGLGLEQGSCFFIHCTTNPSWNSLLTYNFFHLAAMYELMRWPYMQFVCTGNYVIYAIITELLWDIVCYEKKKKMNKLWFCSLPVSYLGNAFVTWWHPATLTGFQLEIFARGGRTNAPPPPLKWNPA